MILLNKIKIREAWEAWEEETGYAYMFFVLF